MTHCLSSMQTCHQLLHLGSPEETYLQLSLRRLEKAHLVGTLC